MYFGNLEEILEKHKNVKIFTEKNKIKENATHAYFKNDNKILKEIADFAVKNRPTTALYSEFKIPDTTGDEASYNKVYFENRKRLIALVITYIITEEEKYLIALEDLIWTICNEYSWALPTTLQGYGLTPGGWKGISQETYLDLCASEYILTFAEIDEIMGEKFSPLIRHRMNEQIFNRGLALYADNKEPFIWESGGTNWASVCGGSMGCAAMYKIKDSKVLAKYINRVLNSLQIFLSTYDEDGACPEGIAYWGYGISNYMFFGELLKQRTGGEIDIMNNEFFHKIALFQQRCIIKNDQVINFSDCPSFYAYRIGMLHKLREKFDDVSIPPMEYTMGFGIDLCYRFPGFIRDYTWFNKEYLPYAKESLSDGFYFKQAQLFLSRKGKAFFATIGGTNGFSHNHNDMGHFVYYIDEKGFFVDLGQATYCKQYFSSERYTFINTSARGHSLPIIADCLEEDGEQFLTKDFCVSKGETDTVSMNLTKGYNCDKLDNFIRMFSFDTNGTVILNDKITLNIADEIKEQFMVNTEIAPTAYENKIILTNKNESVEFSFDDNVTFVEAEKISPSVMNSRPLLGLHLLKFKAKNPKKGENVFQFKIKYI